MNEIVTRASLSAAATAAVVAVRRLETAAMGRPQFAIETTHTFHAGVYARTVKIPAGVFITGAEIKIPTFLVIVGDCIMYGEAGVVELHGHHMLSGQSGRKQAFAAITDTYLTMIFATEAETVEDAEAEFTDETDLLLSRRLEGPQCLE